MRLPAAFLICLLAFFIGAVLSAQDNNLHFGNYGIDDGLTQSSVSSIFQDEQGFMWFGTQEGLNRYDGRRFKPFKNNPRDPNTLPNNYILDMVQDFEGGLWMVSFGGGLIGYDPLTNSFQSFTHDQDPAKGPPDNNLITMFLDADGQIWLGSFEAGLCRFDPKTSRFHHYPFTKQGETGVLGNNVRAIYQDSNGQIWVGTNLGLSQYDAQEDQFTLIRQFLKDGSPVSVRTIMDAPNGFWIGTWGMGLIHYNPSNQDTKIYSHDPNDTASLSNNQIRSVIRDSKGSVWVATMVGLNLMNSTGDFTRFTADSTNPHSLPDNYVLDLYEDQGGVLWVGTVLGLAKLSLINRTFKHYGVNPYGNGLSNNMAYALMEDRAGAIWIGTNGSGLDRLDRSKRQWRNYRSDRNNPHAISNDEVFSLYEDRHDNLWVGTSFAGVNRMDRATGRFTKYPVTLPEGANPFRVEIRGFAEDSQATLWLGGIACGIARLDDSGNFEWFRNRPDDPQSLIDNDVTCLIADQKAGIWIGSRSNGLCLFLNRKVDTHFNTQLSNMSVNSVLQVDDGALWVCTNNGLNLIEKPLSANPGFEFFYESDGLPANTIYGALQDNDGRIWVSSNGGLSMFTAHNRSFTNYGRDHGLQGNEFSMGAYARTQAGELIFGGIKGINLFWPDQVQTNSHVPPIVLTGFRKFNEDVVLDRATPLLEKIDLTYKDSVVSFEFAALDYAAPGRNRYAYQLEGFEDKWIDLGPKNEATFTKLNSGDYVLRVKGSNNDGVWNETGLSLPITVVPPIWATWWAYLIYALLAIALLTITPVLRIRALKQRKQELEAQVSERTRQIIQKNDQLEVFNQQLLMKNREMETLDRIVRTINREFALTGLLETLLDEVTVICPRADKVAFLLLDPRDELFRIGAAKGYESSGTAHIGLTMADVTNRYIDKAQAMGDGIYRVIGLDKDPAAAKLTAFTVPAALLAITMKVDASLIGFLVLDNMSDPNSFQSSDVERLSRLRDHANTAVVKARVMKELADTSQRLKQTQAELLDAAHLAGMAEIATGILHNVGNELNSVSTSAQIIENALTQNRVLSIYTRMVGMVNDHKDRLNEFLTNDPRGKQVPDALGNILDKLQSFNATLVKEIQCLQDHVETIREVVSSQQEYTQNVDHFDSVDFAQLVDDVLKISAEALGKWDVHVRRDFDRLPVLTINRSKLMHVLVNLINNAIDAMTSRPPEERQLTLHAEIRDDDQICIRVSDTGSGIPPEILPKLFEHGFTTKKDGHGFGLHYCANTVHEMRGEMEADSPGEGQGSTFTILIPIRQPSRGLRIGS